MKGTILDYVRNNEPASAEVFNRPLKELVDLLDSGRFGVSIESVLEFNKSIGSDSSPKKDMLININRGSESDSFIKWDETLDRWVFSSDIYVNNNKVYHEGNVDDLVTYVENNADLGSNFEDSNTRPALELGEEWFNKDTAILYKCVFDGSNNIWIDISS